MGIPHDEVQAMHGMVKACATCHRTEDEGSVFATPRSLLCEECRVKSAQARREWTRNYHSARARAVGRLVKEYHPQFEELLDEELGRTG